MDESLPADHRIGADLSGADYKGGIRAFSAEKRKWQAEALREAAEPDLLDLLEMTP